MGELCAEGGIANSDEGSARAEFWAPLWNRPAGCHEPEGLLKEGSAVLNGIRAGIEATNSELKRRHGLAALRVRGQLRVTLAVYLKALACNVKRMVRACHAGSGQYGAHHGLKAGRGTVARPHRASQKASSRLSGHDAVPSRLPSPVPPRSPA